ncbi:MAG: hypothetical protein MZV63_54700 [Marinilabiliales bacterium]|nr:hypothetical protein [Marinilabiliales bacterium]
MRPIIVTGRQHNHHGDRRQEQRVPDDLRFQGRQGTCLASTCRSATGNA